ncbi:helix-turn-helix transcriptional regulator [Hymenobacter tibetensis]|uniref:Helix-turn-helix transcriptional regulator n=1 Tax=Hymenobacter tibetensis TaxID=497967 RepID=A0ABY4CS92_9BACT|nr:helix-turn-helix domain-containing protein [Hymenobacter tibetensis]UOG72962.1 helix-turn-helix transcriptional regulator [Hymenobacter tibetensis]
MPIPTKPPHLHTQACTTAMRSVRDALDLLGGKWKLPIILALLGGPKRFKQLQRDVLGITAKMLSKELKELEMNGLLVRSVQADATPVAVTYTLQSYGDTLFPVIEALHDWGLQHRNRIMHPQVPAVEKTAVFEQVVAA